MRSALIIVAFVPLAILAGTAALGQPAKPGPPLQNPPPQVLIEKLIIRPAGQPSRALRYVLAPDSVDVLPGDAGPQWKKALQLRQQQPQIKDEEWKWISREMPLNKVPVAELRSLVDQFKETLEAAELAARHEHWEWPPEPTGLQALGVNIIDDMQTCRALTNVLAFRLRLDLIEGRFDEAVRTLRIGFALARHFADGPTFLHFLVGIAFARTMTDHVQDFIQTPSAPNLYWALSALPRPCIDLRRPMRHQIDYLTRLFPALRGLEKAPMTAMQAEQLVDDLHGIFVKINEMAGETYPDRKTIVAQIQADYPTAKKQLAKQGHKEQDLAAMPEVQVVMIWYLQRYNEIRDDFYKWLFLPSAEGGEGLNRAKSQIPAKKSLVEQLAAWNLGGLDKMLSAQAKVDRRIAALRCVEAIRLHAALHGKLPARLGEIVDVPVPLDPVTGKPFEYHVYESDKNSALLIGPPLATELPGPHNTLQWELSLQRDR